jgi:TetR/AcrR family transcriptional regulator, cholesterol catabolism regulator
MGKESGPSAPAVPVQDAPVQEAPYDRVVAAASEVLSAGGDEAVQMKDLAQRAGVSLATLYRYFPSRDHVLLAVSLASYQDAARRVFAEPPQGGSVRDRVASYLMREFQAQQRDQRLVAALTPVLTETRRSFSAIIETIEHLHLQIVRHIAAAGESLSEQQEKLLPVVIDIFSAATRHWLTGKFTASDVMFQVEIGCQLLELPDGVVDSELARAAPDVRIRITDRSE